MNRRLLWLVAGLAAVSAVVGASAALLLGGEDDAFGVVNVFEEVSEPDESEPIEQAAQQEQPEPEQDEQAAAEQSQDDGPAPYATLSPGTVTQGEAFALAAGYDESVTAMATMSGRSWSLSSISPSRWWGIVAVPRDAEPGIAVVTVDFYGEGGTWLRSVAALVVVRASTAPLENVVLGAGGDPIPQAEIQRDHDVRFVEHVGVTGPARWSGAWQLPVEGEVSGVFGAERTYDGVPSASWHHGHDIAAHHGDPIAAAAPGTVVWTGDVAIHGMGVIIDHGAGVYSGYWHMSSIVVVEGSEVAQGDWLGNIGSTGISTGPHIHWEVIVQGVDVDPVQWTTERQPPVPALTQDQAEQSSEQEVEQAADTLTE